MAFLQAPAKYEYAPVFAYNVQRYSDFSTARARVILPDILQGHAGVRNRKSVGVQPVIWAA